MDFLITFIIKYLVLLIFVFITLASVAKGGAPMENFPQQQQMVEPEIFGPNPPYQYPMYEDPYVDDYLEEEEPLHWWTESSFIALMGMLTACIPAVLGYRQYRRKKDS